MKFKQVEDLTCTHTKIPIIEDNLPYLLCFECKQVTEVIPDGEEGEEE